MRISRAGAAAAAAVAALLACDRPDGNAADLPAWTVSDEPVVTIGELEGDPAYLFQSIAAARFLPDGRIVVADGGRSVVRVFGPEGEFRTEMGGSGDGPGEFRRIRDVWIDPPDTIGVWDSRSRRLTAYRADGSLVRSAPLGVPTGAPEGGHVDAFVGTFSDGDVALASIRAGPRRGDRPSPDRMWVLRFGTDGAFEGVIGELAGMRRIPGAPTPFSPFPHATVHRDSVYSTDGLVPEIVVRDRDGAVARTLELPPAGIDPDAAWAALEEELRDAEGPMTVERLETVPRTDSIPHLAGLLVDDRGRIWAKRYEPRTDALWLGRERGRGGEWWVAEPDGELVAAVGLPDGLAPLDVQGDRLLGLVTGELGVERVVVHRVAR